MNARSKASRSASATGSNGARTGLVRRFVRGESGAVTVDWIVLTAAMMGLAVVAMNAVGSGVDNASTDMRKCIKRQANVILSKDGWDYDRRMRVAARRCGRL